MPSGVKHYYTSETLLDQRGPSTIGFKLKYLEVRQIKVEKVLYCKTASFLTYPKK